MSSTKDLLQLLISPAALSIPLGAAFDALVRRPPSWPRPERAIERFVNATEYVLRKYLLPHRSKAWYERLIGLDLALVVVGTIGVAAAALVLASDRAGWAASLVVRTVVVGMALAARSLADEAKRCALAPDLESARKELATIINREVDELDWAQVRAACVETIGENASDRVIAPLFWLAILGPGGLWAFKAISALDKSLDRKAPSFRNVGRPTDRIHAAAGWIPAKLTWILTALAALFRGQNAKGAFAIGWRDGRKSTKPNAGWGVAAMAGALEVQIGGPGVYDGGWVEKPLIGNGTPIVEAAHVARAVILLQTATLLAVGLAVLGKVGMLTILR